MNVTESPIEDIIADFVSILYSFCARLNGQRRAKRKTEKIVQDKPDDDTEYTFSGKRIGRRNRLYRTKDGKIICADVNGSYNILRKSKPDAFAHVDAKGIAAYVVQPLRLAITV